MNTNKVNVFGKEYEIKKAEIASKGFLGLCHVESGYIEIDKTVKGKELIRVTLHECFHAVVHRIGIGQAINHELEEIIVDSFATFIMENFLVSDLHEEHEQKKSASKKKTTVKKVASR